MQREVGEVRNLDLTLGDRKSEKKTWKQRNKKNRYKLSPCNLHALCG